MRCMTSLAGAGTLGLFIVLAAATQPMPAPQPGLAGQAAGQAAFRDVIAPVDFEIRPGNINLRVGDVRTNELPNLLAAPRAALAPDQRFVLQLDGPITHETRQRLEDLGLVLGGYLPSYSYIVSMNDAAPPDPAQLAQTGLVRWLGEYRDEWKLDPEIGLRPYATTERQELDARGDVALTITLFHDADVDVTVQQIAAIPGAVVYWTERYDDSAEVSASMPRAAVAQLAQMSDVQFVEDAPEITLRSNTNNRWIVQSNVSGFHPLYNNGIRGEGQVLGLMDGRMNPNHCSFVHSGVPFGANHRKILAYNTTTGNDSHGTHVAGTAVGNQINNTANNTQGVAWMAKLVFNIIPSFSDAGVYSAHQTHHNQGARVHSNSWGNDGTVAYDGLARGIDRFSRDFEDSLICLAVTNQSTLRNPENAKNLLAVAATQAAPNQHNFCSGGTGPTNDSRRKPEIMAPGCSTNSSVGGVCSTQNMTGTSMACPAVAGAGLLARQYFTAGYYPSGTPTPSDAFTPTGALVKAVLLNSAVNMTGMSGYPGNVQGWGRVLLNNTLYFPGDARRLVVHQVRNANGLSTGQQHTYNFNVTSSAQRLEVTMVFTDVPANSGANPAYVNNLDLEVIAPNGNLYRGNVFSGGQSTTGGTADFRNNVEQVHLNSPPVGNWTVQIKGANVAQGAQGYALVISGAVESGPLPPDNNTCGNSIVIGEGNTAFDNTNATTTGPNEPSMCNISGDSNIQSDVWYRYIATCDGTLTVSACDASFAAKIGLYQDVCPPFTDIEACDLTSCPAASRPQASLNVLENALVVIRVGGHNGAQGSGVLDVTMQCASGCPADLTGDGVVDVLDMLMLFAAWGANPGHPADLNGDGVVDVLDMLALFAAWGSC